MVIHSSYTSVPALCVCGTKYILYSVVADATNVPVIAVFDEFVHVTPFGVFAADVHTM